MHVQRPEIRHLQAFLPFSFLSRLSPSFVPVLSLCFTTLSFLLYLFLSFSYSLYSILIRSLFPFCIAFFYLSLVFLPLRLILTLTATFASAVPSFPSFRELAPSPNPATQQKNRRNGIKKNRRIYYTRRQGQIARMQPSPFNCKPPAPQPLADHKNRNRLHRILNGCPTGPRIMANSSRPYSSTSTANTASKRAGAGRHRKSKSIQATATGTSSAPCLSH